MVTPALAPNTYTNPAGRLRELVIRPGACGSLLVVDRDPKTLCDRRLVAHIAADEPAENALLVGRMYMRERGARICRALTADDLLRAPACAPDGEPSGGEESGRRSASGVGVRSPETTVSLSDGDVLYALRAQRPVRDEAPELRWHRRMAGECAWLALTVRDALGALESYEPLRTLTLRAVAAHARDPRVSVRMLRRELARVEHSALVLNRGLREAVLHAVEQRGLSLGEIAMRCGMVKRSRHDRLCGDASWLSRRVGLMAEGGRRAPNRWVHSDTLAFIARQGLGLSPREVELG